MREIKFRAWDVEEKCWIPDTHICISATGMILTWEEFHKRWIEETIEIIICLYTGLKDKNGKDIWEGDILSVPAEGTWPEYKYIVDFWHGSFVAKETGSSGLNNYPNNFNFRVSEVIGNIYEHSHLLKGESNEAK